MLIRCAEVEGRIVDVRITGGNIAEIRPTLDAQPGEAILQAGGGALLPGLHDHHLHLMALAAAESSLRCGPPQVLSRAALEAVFRSTTGSGWLRGIGYHESVAGDLDRDDLDSITPERPLRLQHRSGAMWMLNSEGVRALRLDEGADAPGVERDEHGRATGRLYRLDNWLRSLLGDGAPPSLASVSQRLATFGVTGLTDATPSNDETQLALFEGAAASGALKQRLRVMGKADLRESAHPRVERGARKFLLHEDELPEFESMREAIETAHETGRAVAIHCVTRAELVFALGALEAAGRGPLPDRIEHAAITPPDLRAALAELGVTVVTQPNFIRERGDVYRRDIERQDLPFLYPCGRLIEAGVAVGGGTDAPFGDPNPWLAMQAAVDRRTFAGHVLGRDERLSPERALGLFTSPPLRPGAPPRRVAVGAAADLCLLSRPWLQARDTLSHADVEATLCGGEVVYGKSGDGPSASL